MLTHNNRHHMASSFFNLNFTITNLILLLLLLLHQHSITIFVVALTENENNTETSPPPTPIPEDATTIPQRTFTPFKPSVAIVISVFTVLFSVTFLLLLYIKHINNTTNAETINIESSSYGGSGGGISSFSAGRKNSGVDRSVVESLPIFKFGSLTGQKEGLDCAVCLSKFESSEVLRLLPKCKHAFHVECVDTWLDAHSTCPLCRYRVDPEDILLVMENSSSSSVSRDSRQIQNQKEKEDECVVEIERGTMTRNEIAEYYRKRHSSVGEKEWERERERRKTASFRFSLDSSRKKNDSSSVGIGVGLGCFVGPGPRKDGMLLTKEEITERSSVDRRRRLEHRIIVSPSVTNTIRSGLHKNQRWSDVQPCDLLYLTSEMMIMSESRRVMKKNMNKRNSNDSCWNGRGEINSRSVSEITGFNRFQTNNTTTKQ
ncbi:RING/U-box superfamily protein [Trifolium repens]|nr:RING/U-box superfamily protein [Trifolium repens]